MPVATKVFVYYPAGPIGNNFSGRPLTLQPSQISAYDNSNNLDTSYVTNCVASLNVLTGSPVLSGTTTKPFVAGVVAYTDLVVTGAGTYTITFSSGTLASSTSGTLKTYAATQLVVVTQPGTIPAGAGASYPYVPIKIEARTPGNALDTTVGVASGATVNDTDPRADIVITTPGGAVLTGPTKIGFYAGVLTGRGLAVSLAGTYTYTVSYNGVSVVSGSFTVSAAVDTFYNPANILTGLGVALPRAVPSASVPVQAGATWTVGGGGNYATIAQAEAAWAAGTINYGDTIVLLDGNTFVETVTWRAKAWTSGVLVIRSQTEPTPAGQRTKPADWTTQAIWEPGAGTQPALSFAYQAKRIRLQCVHFQTNPANADSSSFVELGFNDGEAALVTSSGTVPDFLAMDRCYLNHTDPTATHRARRGVRWRSGNSAIIHCYFTGFQGVATGQDAQSVLVDNTPGPLLFDNNYTDGESENFMIGGNDWLREDLMTRDVTITRNLFRKPFANLLTWGVKNLLELKAGHRVRITGNIFDGYWDAGLSQPSAINIKTVNQSGVGAQGYTGTSDVALYNNFVRNVPDFVATIGAPQGEVEPTSRVIVWNNGIVNVRSLTWYDGVNAPAGYMAHVGQGFDFAQAHQSYVSAPKANLQGNGLALAVFPNANTRSTFANILLVTDGSAGVFVSGTNAAPTMNGVTAACDAALVWAKNYLSGLAAGNAAGQNAQAPVGNTFVDLDGGGNVVDPGFTGGLSWRATAATDDPLTILDALKPTVGSVLHNAGSDGFDIGLADIAGLKTAITGVLLGVYTGGAVGGTATQLAFTTQPSGAVNGVPFTVQPVVALRDASGATSTDVRAVALDLIPVAGAGELLGVSRLTSNAGVVSFSGLGVASPVGTFQLRASSPGLTTAVSLPFSIGSPVPSAQTQSTTQRNFIEAMNAATTLSGLLNTWEIPLSDPVSHDTYKITIATLKTLLGL